jgi:hypothetical protein
LFDKKKSDKERNWKQEQQAGDILPIYYKAIKICAPK